MSDPSPIHISPEFEERLATSGQEFLADFLRRGSRRNPGNLVALSALAQVLTQLGRIREGLEADQRLAALAPKDAMVHYNLACSLCLLERNQEALDALEKSIDLGYDDLPHMLQDEDLMGLNEERRFQELAKRLGDQ